MEDKRVSRTNDCKYWNDPDYKAALAELGVSESPSDAKLETKPGAREDPPDRAPRKDLFEILVPMPLDFLGNVFVVVSLLFKALGVWASITPAIWIFNLLFRTHIPGIERLILLVLGLNHPVWWWNAR